MYITINNTRYPCTGYRTEGDGTAAFSGVEGLTLPVSGTVTLRTDGGFALCERDCGSFARQTYEAGTLTLTNEPEPEPAPETETVQPPSSADMAEALIDLDTRVSMLEMGVN